MSIVEVLQCVLKSLGWRLAAGLLSAIGAVVFFGWLASEVFEGETKAFDDGSFYLSWLGFGNKRSLRHCFGNSALSASQTRDNYFVDNDGGRSISEINTKDFVSTLTSCAVFRVPTSVFLQLS